MKFLSWTEAFIGSYLVNLLNSFINDIKKKLSWTSAILLVGWTVDCFAALSSLFLKDYYQFLVNRELK